VDEAGRGPLAGPVVAAALILPPGVEIPGVNDSKKLSEKRRTLLEKQIKEQAVSYGVGWASVQEIERINILQSTFLAMKRAVDKLSLTPQFVLVDGRDYPRFVYQSNSTPLPGRALIGGDGLSASIAGASILAKVYRDNLMEEYGEIYPQYGFERHKGYATASHREKILQIGACPIHRKTFLRKILK
jgi:ribonuclease HII